MQTGSVNFVEITKKVTIPDIENVASSINRDVRSCLRRWELYVRHWLLRYYNKTLNLEITPMLANVLADNFNSIENIDWMLVLRIYYPGTQKNLLQSSSKCIQETEH